MVKKIQKSGNAVWKMFLDCLYPRRCPVCGEIAMPKGALICPDCEKKISWVDGPVCKSCGRQVSDETTEYCPDCMRRRHSFDGGVALCNYNEAARTSMGKIKYQGRREYLDYYGQVFVKHLGRNIACFHPDVLVPVPVHPDRKKKGDLTRQRCWRSGFQKNWNNSTISGFRCALICFSARKRRFHRKI